ncbi:MAG: TraR/DksA C4-type zinc finger protein [Desulfobacterales bacterium]|nr:TraR/DksA C4-type zinc finger protein [Desulfobacterales bacterium]
MDEADLGNRFADRYLNEALAGVRTRMPKGESRTECEDCGEDIPEARRKAVPGCVRCVNCESLNERKTW